MVQASDVQKLRRETGAGIMECKKALSEADGDFTKAKEIIKERGLTKADTKSVRVAEAGRIESYIHNDRVGVLLEIHSETDFVARSEPFMELAHNIAMQIAAMNPENVESLLTQEFIKDPKTTISELVKGCIAKLGENIQVIKFTRYEI
jgi:elongation factor Ts